MKKLMMMFAFLSFVAIAGANAQSCCAKKAASCSASASTAAAPANGDAMVKKVANTSEACTKSAGAKACCAKDKAAGCSKTTSTTDANAPKRSTKLVSVEAAPAPTTANE